MAARDIVTKEQLDAAKEEFDSAVEDRVAKENTYADTVAPWQEARLALRKANAREKAADKAYEDLQKAYETPPVPAVPTDESL